MRIVKRIIFASIFVPAIIAIVTFCLKFIGLNTNNYDFKAIRDACFEMPLDKTWNHYGKDGFEPNRQLAANATAEFAVLAANTYFPPDEPALEISGLETAWQKRDSYSTIGGLRLDVYMLEVSSARFKHAFVFRGTDGADDIPDMISNLSWFTQLFNPWDQYRSARNYVNEYISALPKSAKHSFVAVGHSLGGGIARHVATAFPCTNSVAFNASFVTNEFILRRVFRNSEMRLFEEGEWLSAIENSVFGQPRVSDVTTTREWSRQNLTLPVSNLDKDPLSERLRQHKIMFLVAGLGRMSVCCHQAAKWRNGYCEIDPSDKRGWNVWCTAFGEEIGAIDGLCDLGSEPTRALACLE